MYIIHSARCMSNNARASLAPETHNLKESVSAISMSSSDAALAPDTHHLRDSVSATSKSDAALALDAQRDRESITITKSSSDATLALDTQHLRESVGALYSVGLVEQMRDFAAQGYVLIRRGEYSDALVGRVHQESIDHFREVSSVIYVILRRPLVHVIGVWWDTEWFIIKLWSCSITHSILSTMPYNVLLTNNACLSMTA